MLHPFSKNSNRQAQIHKALHTVVRKNRVPFEHGAFIPATENNKTYIMHLLIALDSSPLNERITGFLKHFFDQLKEIPILSFIHVIDSRIIGTAAGVPGVTMNYDVPGMSLEDEDVLIKQLRKDAG